MLPRIREILEIDRIEAWQSLLVNLQQAIASTDLFYVNIWGSRGVGKTMFLELFYKYILKHGYVSLSVRDIEKTPYPLLKEDISKFLADDSDTEKKKIILLDHLDALNEKDHRDFEKTLQNMVIKGGSMVIATSQAKLEWLEAIVRNSSIFFLIQPFSKKDVEKLSTVWELDPASAYELTFGHPQALVWLRENPALDKSTMAERAYVFFLQYISEEAKELAIFASLFPGFDPSTIQELLPSDSSLHNRSKQEINNLLNELMKEGLIVRDDENEYYYRYADGAVRRLLSAFFWIQTPAAFNDVQHLAAEYFQNQAKYVGYLKMAFINVLYHLALSAKSKKGAGPKCLSWLRENIVLTDDTDQSVMLRGWETGNGDPSVIEELKEIIGMKYYEEIRSVIEKAASRNKLDEGELFHE